MDAITSHRVLRVAYTKPEIENCSFLWIVERFSKLKEDSTIESPSFFSENRKCEWILKLYPAVSDGNTQWICLSLRLRDDVIRQDPSGLNFPEKVSRKSTLMNSDGKVLYAFFSREVNFYKDFSEIDGYLIERRKLCSQLKDDVLKIRVDITANFPPSTKTFSYERPQRNIAMSPLGNPDFMIRFQDAGIQAHKSVLSEKSSVLKEMLVESPSSTTQSKLLQLVDIPLETGRALVNFMYDGEVKNLDVSLALDLLKAGEKYDMPDLLKECSAYLKAEMCSVNVLRILKSAFETKLVEFEKLCVHFITQNRDIIKMDREEKILFEKRKSELTREISIIEEDQRASQRGRPNLTRFDNSY